MGKGKTRFYCTECGRYMDRFRVRAVEDETEETIYYCKCCGSPVIKMDKVLRAWLDECVEYIVKKGQEERFW